MDCSSFRVTFRLQRYCPRVNRCITAAPANLSCDDHNMGSSQRWLLWQSLWWFVSSVLAHWSARAQGIRLQRQSTFSCQFALQFWARLGSQQYSTIRTRKNSTAGAVGRDEMALGAPFYESLRCSQLASLELVWNSQWIYTASLWHHSTGPCDLFKKA